MHHSPPPPDVRLAEVVAAMALATDLGMGRSIERSLRGCLLAMAFGHALGMADADLQDVYYVALLRWAGCTAAVAHDDELRDTGGSGRLMDRVAVWNDAGIAYVLWEATDCDDIICPCGRTIRLPVPRRRAGAVAYGEIAQNLARGLGLRQQVVDALRQIAQRWDGLGSPGLAPAAAVAQIAIDAELFERLGGVEFAVDLVRRRAGTLYDPILAMCFCRAAGELFPRMACQSAWQAVLAAEPGAQRQLHGVRLDEALQAIGDAADLHTRGAAGHARMVAVLAESAAERCALPKWDAITLRYAGLVQDIGMFAVTAGLGAQGRPLNEAEREHVRLHPYYMERILARSLALAAIGALAALHHERLDGSGSYRGLSAAQLPLTARILAAADVYAALSQPRPYRTASPPGAAAEELRREVREGHLDSDAVSAVLAAAGHRVRGTRGMHLAGLMDREIEVLRLLSSGLVNHQMAEALGISTNTVDHHIRHIYNKIDASSRAAATRFAMQHQIVDPAWHDGSSISAEK